MVWIRFGRGRRGGYGGYRGYGGLGGYPRGYGRRRRRGGGGGGCLRDLFLVETGCCLAEAMGCGPQLFLLAPAAVRLLAGSHRHHDDASFAVRLVRLYQSRISAVRDQPCCRLAPSCSAYAIDALTAHGAVRGIRLTAARLLRCRPSGPTGSDPAPVR